MAEPVKLYTLSTCGHCKATKTLLNECEVKYDYTDVDLLHGDERAAILEDVKNGIPSAHFQQSSSETRSLSVIRRMKSRRPWGYERGSKTL